MQALLRLIVLFALLAISLGQMAGGWRQADATDVNVIASARFAVNEALGTDAEFKILDANKQVVAGMKYDMTIQITRPNGACTINHFQVWDRFGERTLAISEQLSDKCADAAHFTRGGGLRQG